jgi:hypothetical protein
MPSTPSFTSATIALIYHSIFTCKLAIGTLVAQRILSRPSLTLVSLQNPFQEVFLEKQCSACVLGGLTRNHLPIPYKQGIVMILYIFPFLGLNHKPPNSHPFCPCVACWISSFVGNWETMESQGLELVLQ